jgi:hypothetical protein
MAETEKKNAVLALSQYLGKTPKELRDKGLLNTVLGTDTKLFIDPKLLRETAIPEFIGAIEDMEQYFDLLIRANQAGAKYPMSREQAINMLAIKEPPGLSIGYGDKRDSGTAIQRPVAIKALSALSQLVGIGLEDEKLLEIMGLYIKKFGSDSISDLTAHIIYPRLLSFTDRMAKELKLNVRKYTYEGKEYLLPYQPVRPLPIIFLPLEVLSPLPVATSWSEIAEAARRNAQTRREFNNLVGKSVKAYAKKVKEDPDTLIHSKEAVSLLMDIYDKAPASGYDSNKDSSGYIRISDYADEVGRTRPRASVEVATPTDMVNFVKKEVIDAFQYDVENIGTNTLLYQQATTGKVYYDKPLREEAAQLLFHVAVSHACWASNVLHGREPKMGKSSVDFWIASTPRNKVLVELKKSNNPNLLDGYDKQLKRYMENERASAAFYLILIVDPKDLSAKSDLFELRKRVAQKIEKGEKCPILIEVNALEQIPPSKLRSNK